MKGFPIRLLQSRHLLMAQAAVLVILGLLGWTLKHTDAAAYEQPAQNSSVAVGQIDENNVYDVSDALSHDSSNRADLNGSTGFALVEARRLVDDYQILDENMSLTPFVRQMLDLTEEEHLASQRALTTAFEEVKQIESQVVQYIETADEAYYEIPSFSADAKRILHDLQGRLNPLLGDEKSAKLVGILRPGKWFSGDYKKRVSLAIRNGELALYEGKWYKGKRMGASYATFRHRLFESYFRHRYGHVIDLDTMIPEILQQESKLQQISEE